MLRRLAPERFSVVQRVQPATVKTFGPKLSKGPRQKARIPSIRQADFSNFLSPSGKVSQKNSSTIPKMLRLGVLPSRLVKNVLGVY